MSFDHVLSCFFKVEGPATLLVIGQGRPSSGIPAPICGPYKLPPLKNILLYNSLATLSISIPIIFFGYYIRMRDEGKRKQVMKVRKKGKRVRRKSRMTFIDKIEEKGRKGQNDFEGVKRLAKNIEGWEKWIELIPTLVTGFRYCHGCVKGFSKSKVYTVVIVYTLYIFCRNVNFLVIVDTEYHSIVLDSIKRYIKQNYYKI